MFELKKASNHQKKIFWGVFTFCKFMKRKSQEEEKQIARKTKKQKRDDDGVTSSQPLFRKKKVLNNWYKCKLEGGGHGASHVGLSILPNDISHLVLGTLRTHVLDKLSTMLPISMIQSIVGFAIPVTLVGVLYQKLNLSLVIMDDKQQLFFGAHFLSDFLHLYRQLKRMEVIQSPKSKIQTMLEEKEPQVSLQQQQKKRRVIKNTRRGYLSIINLYCSQKDFALENKKLSIPVSHFPRSITKFTQSKLEVPEVKEFLRDAGFSGHYVPALRRRKQHPDFDATSSKYAKNDKTKGVFNTLTSDNTCNEDEHPCSCNIYLTWLEHNIAPTDSHLDAVKKICGVLPSSIDRHNWAALLNQHQPFLESDAKSPKRYFPHGDVAREHSFFKGFEPFPDAEALHSFWHKHHPLN